MRDKSIDAGRGLLVLMMIYGHVLQFFGDPQMFPIEYSLMDAINLNVFPTFVFFFGVTGTMAYLSKPYRRALPGMIRTCLRAYAAFVLSGVGYRVLRENKAFAVGTVRRVMQLTDIPGWSEFLIAFAIYALMLLVLFPLLKKLMNRPGVTLMIAIVCLCCCEIVPYGKVKPTQLALLIGGRDFSYFPIVQYMPYFLAGLVYTGANGRTRLHLLGVAVIASAAGIFRLVALGMPGRFPPDAAWIALPVMGTTLIFLLAKGLCAVRLPKVQFLADLLTDALAHLGGRSLYYLLGSNLVLFTMSGKGIMPQMARKSVLPWTAPIQSPQGAAAWTAILILSLAFIASLAGRGAKSKPTH